MKCRMVVLLFGFFAGITAVAQSSQLAQFLEKYRLETLAKQSFAQTGLSAGDCKKLVPLLTEMWYQEVSERLQEQGEALCIRRGDRVLRYEGQDFGEPPEDGYSLYISLHGGGAAPKEVNDQQWKNQIELYAPAQGIYIAPRAPWDDWNMWFKPGIDELFEDLIQWMVVSFGVNPNRVYLLGYSAGGDGVWRLAPRMADRWAAAAMMAGHPGEARQENLRNVPFQIWMGEKDAAYQRNAEAVRKGEVLDSLEAAYPLSYIHETHIVKDKGHWMERQDSVAVDWLANFERDPLPYALVWRQEEVVRPNFYWLEVDQREAQQGMRVDAELEGNTIQLLRCDYRKLRIYLNDEMVDLDQPVKVVYQGKVLFEGMLKRTLANMARTLAQRGDTNWIFPSVVEVTIN